MIQDFLSGGGGGSRPDGKNTGSVHGTNTHARARARTHTHTHIHTYIRMYRQTHEADGWTYMYMYRRQLKDNLFKTCIIMYRDNVRNRHVRACRGIQCTCASHYLKISHENEWFGPIEPNLFHFHRISKNGGHGGGMKPNWIRHCLYMHIHVALCMSMQLVCTSKIYGPSCLMNLDRVVL